MIYEHKAIVTVSGGSVGTTTLNVLGGLARNLLIRALTNGGTGTIFRADLTDEDGVARVNWGYENGELNDHTLHFPITGRYTINITNASATDTFRVILGVAE